MSEKQAKLIVVIGATGNQGSSVAHTFLSLPNWRVRCLTRNPDSAAAQKLQTLGAEVVQADLDDVSTLQPAFAGAHSIFANTDFWGFYRAPDAATAAEAVGKSLSQYAFDREVQHGINAAHAASEVSDLQHFVYSALGPAKRHSHGKYPHSHHWDAKDTIVERIMAEYPALGKKMSTIYLGAYMTNPFLLPKWNDKAGMFMYVVPMAHDTRMPIVNPQESTGPFVKALVEAEPAGTKLLAYDSYLTMDELVEVWTRVTGKKTGFLEMSIEALHKMSGVPLEVLDGPGFIKEFGFMGGVEGFIEPPQLKELPKTETFEEWLKKQDLKDTLEAGEATFKEVQGK